MAKFKHLGSVIDQEGICKDELTAKIQCKTRAIVSAMAEFYWTYFVTLFQDDESNYKHLDTLITRGRDDQSSREMIGFKIGK